MTCCPRRLGLAIVLSVMLGALLPAVDTPSPGEQAPFRRALADGDLSVRPEFTRFMQDRAWLEGWVMLAELDQMAGDYAATLKHASAGLEVGLAMRIQRGGSTEPEALRARAAALAINAANALGRYTTGLERFNQFGNHSDPGGLANRAAAESALGAGNLSAADRYLATAMNAATKQGTIPPDYHLLKARIYEQRSAGATNDADAADMLESAATSYARALDAGYEGEAIAFNLARLQRQLALRQTGDRRLSLLDQAQASCTDLLQNNPNDAAAAVLMGLIQLDRGELLTGSSRAADAHRSAYNAFDTALRRLEDSSDHDPQTRGVALSGRGSARLKVMNAEPELAARDNGTWNYRSARNDLEQAQAILGDTPAVTNNLLSTYLGLQAEASDASERKRYTQRITELMASGATVDPLIMALSELQLDLNDVNPTAADRAIDANNRAAELLALACSVRWTDAGWEHATPGLPEDEVAARRLQSGLRYLGHALRAAVDIALREPDLMGENEIELLTNQARDAYRLAGTYYDPISRDWYLTVAARSPGPIAYQAGWDHVVWNGFLSLSGWRQMLANYGSAQAWKQPLHLVVWALVIIVPLGLALKGLIIGKPIEVVERPSRAPASKAARPAPTGAKPGTSSTKRPGTARTAPPANAQPRHDETLKPNTEMRAPQAGNALERQAPTPATNDQAQRTIDDVARRLARQHRDDAGDAPTKRSPPRSSRRRR